MAIDRSTSDVDAVTRLSRLQLRPRTLSVSATVAGLSFAAVVVRVLLARKIVTPWAFVDELIYSELAKSLAAGGHFLIRDRPAPSFGRIYPLLISPGWLADSTASAYAVAKAINAVVMTLAIVPVYLWAKRLVSPAYALVASVLFLLLPSFVYTGTLLTENAFFPAFLLAGFLIALTLERPTVARQTACVAAILLASAVRLQGVALFLVLPSAIILVCLFDLRARREPISPRRLAAGLRRYWATGSLLAALAIGYVVIKLLQASSLASGLGAYREVGQAHYSIRLAVRWFVFHLAELCFSVGIAPASALVILSGLAWRPGFLTRPSERAFVAVALPATLWFSAESALFASRFSLRVEERYMFYVAPLLLLALVLWLDRGLPRPSGLTAAAILIPAGLLISLPLESLLNISILSATFGLIPLLRVSSLLSGHTDDVRILLSAGAIGVGLAFASVPRRIGVLLIPAGIALFLTLSSYVVFGTVRDYARSLDAAVGATDRDWIDDRAGRSEHVPYFFSAGTDVGTASSILWVTEFWNRSVGNVYSDGPRELGSVTEQIATLDRGTGRLRLGVGDEDARFVVTDSRVALAGRALTNQGSLALYEVKRPLRIASSTEGVYADGWMGEDAAYARYDTPGNRQGRIRVSLSRTNWTGPDIPGSVRIEVGRLKVGEQGDLVPSPVTSASRWVVHSAATRSFDLRSPRPPFVVRVHVSPTFSPAQFGQADSRQLGAQVTFTWVSHPR